MSDVKKGTHRRLGIAVAGLAGVFVLGAAGCKSKPDVAPIVNGNGQDPADANMAQPYTGGSTGGYNNSGPNTKVLGASQAYEGQASGENYPQGNGQQYGDDQQQAAPIIRQAPEGGAPPPGYAEGQGYSDAEEAGAQAIADTDQAPPPLPEYDQPPAPEPNYLWTPGYWNYASAGYYWVPGVWVAPPFYGALWTPPWWGFGGGRYLFHRGYWGPHVGYYGGIDYGFGYTGFGYYGGYWRGRDFLYNRAVTNINVGAIHGYYDHPVILNGTHYGPQPGNRVSYNGGRGGINVQPRPAEIAAMHEAHYAPEAAQRQVRMEAAANRGQFFRADGGHPAQAFAGRPVGSPGNIAAAPHEAAFNRVGAAGAPGTANSGVRPGFVAGRPGAPAAAAAAAAHGGYQPSARPGEPNHAGSQPGEFNRTPNAGNQPGTFNRAPNGAEQPGNLNRAPAAAGQAGGYNRTPNAGNQPGGFNHAPGGAGAVNRPTAPEPRTEQARPAAPIERSTPAPERQGAPIQRQAVPQAAPRPQPEARPAPQARPAPAPRPQAAPHAAPAPHGGGGGDHNPHH